MAIAVDELGEEKGDCSLAVGNSTQGKEFPSTCDLQ